MKSLWDRGIANALLQHGPTVDGQVGGCSGAVALREFADEGGADEVDASTHTTDDGVNQDESSRNPSATASAASQHDQSDNDIVSLYQIKLSDVERFQFDGGVATLPQAEFAARTSRFATEMYTGDSSRGDQIIYAFDAYPAEALEAKYPGTVSPIAGDRMGASRIVKISFAKMDRIDATRYDLNRILPGHDPRLFMRVRVPEVSDEEMRHLFEDPKDPLFKELADFRIGLDERKIIPGPRGASYTELVVADSDLKEIICSMVTSIVDRHNEGLREKLKVEVDGALALLTEANMQTRLKDAELLLKDHTISHREATISHLEAALKKSEEECERLSATMDQIIPRKLSALKSMLTRSS